MTYTMKISNYNAYLPYKNGLVVYNSLRDTCLMVYPDNEVVLAMQSQDNSKLKSFSDEQLKLFVENQMIVDENVDEIEEIKSQLEATNSRSDFFILTINPTLSCNFRCWYCYEEHKSKPHMDASDVERVDKCIEKILSTESINELSVSFFGGEPLLAFVNVVKPIVEHTACLASKYGKRYSIQMTTNAYLLKPEYADFLSKYNIQHYQITLDGNKQRHNKVRSDAAGNGSYDEIVTNIKYALSLGNNVIVRLNISEETNLDVPLLLNDFDGLPSESKQHLIFSVHQIWQAENLDKSLINKIIEQVRERGYECNPYHHSGLNLKRTCYADKNNHFIINPKGEVYGCTARDFDEKTIEGHLDLDGVASFNERRQTRLSMSPLQNEECKQCFILPMCGGGCKTRIFETKDYNSCKFGYSKDDKIKFSQHYITERFR